MLHSIKRRQFIIGSVAASAAATMPRFSRAQASNETVGVAVIGAGGRGGEHISQYLNDKRVDIRYVIDADEGTGGRRCDEIEKKQGSRPKFSIDLRRALDDPAIQMVSTATPNHWHALVGVWAMQAGKDAYIEKPVSHNIAEGSALVAAARKYKRMCQVGTQCRSSKAIYDAFAFMREGGIGDVNFARGLCYKRRKSIGSLGDYAIPDGVDYNLWSGPAEFTTPKVTRSKFHYDWHWQRLYGNGDLGNQGPHQTDVARWGLGLDRHPSRVISYGGRLGYQAERTDPNYVDAGDTANTEVSIYDYGDKCIVFETRGLDVDGSADDELNKLFESTMGNKVGVVFYGTQGYLVQQAYDECAAFDKDFNLIKRFKGGGDHFQNFVDACYSRKAEDLNAEVREGHLSAAVSHLGNISYYLGENNRLPASEIKQQIEKIKSLDDNVATFERTIKHLEKNGVDLEKHPLSLGPYLSFDSQREIFPDSPEATELCSRKYREGFVCPKADQV